MSPCPIHASIPRRPPNSIHVIKLIPNMVCHRIKSVSTHSTLSKLIQEMPKHTLLYYCIKERTKAGGGRGWIEVNHETVIKWTGPHSPI